MIRCIYDCGAVYYKANDKFQTGIGWVQLLKQVNQAATRSDNYYKQQYDSSFLFGECHQVRPSLQSLVCNIYEYIFQMN